MKKLYHKGRKLMNIRLNTICELEIKKIFEYELELCNYEINSMNGIDNE